jgi:hypothetical protein
LAELYLLVELIKQLSGDDRDHSINLRQTRDRGPRELLVISFANWHNNPTPVFFSVCARNSISQSAF